MFGEGISRITVKINSFYYLFLTAGKGFTRGIVKALSLSFVLVHLSVMALGGFFFMQVSKNISRIINTDSL